MHEQPTTHSSLQDEKILFSAFVAVTDLLQISEVLEMNRTEERVEKIDELNDVEQLRQTDVAFRRKSILGNPVETISDVLMKRNDTFVVGKLT